MAEQWCITITSEGASPFVPDVYVDPGTPAPTALIASTGDLVSWNNQTEGDHDLAITDENYKVKTPGSSITNPIAPWKPSPKGYVTATADATPVPPATVTFPVTIYYACTVHPGEHGTIELIA
jgi:plastocyanin